MHELINETTTSKIQEPLASLVKRLGTPASTSLLHSNCFIFHIPQIDGVIGYHLIGNCAVVIGDPICLPKDAAELTTAFHLYCEQRNLKIVYLLTYQDFADWAIDNGCRTRIQVGSELTINPTKFDKKQKLRWKINQAIEHGVQIKEYKNFDPSLENQIKNTIETWLKQRRGPQIHVGGIHFFNKEVEKRIFYAEQKGKMIGVLMLFPVDRFHGWVVSSYLALTEAPAGTTEHLMGSTIDALANENCQFLCLGAASDANIHEIVGLNSFSKTLTRLIFKLARWLFKLDKKAIYLNKYHPNSRSIYLLSRYQITTSELFAIKHILHVKLW